MRTRDILSESCPVTSHLPDLLVPAQFFSDRWLAGQASGEMALRWAVFADGLSQYWKLAADCAGQGTDLVLIHGLGGSLRDWDPIVPELSRHHRLLRWDVRGFGDSDKPSGPYSPQLFARDLVGLMRALSVTRTHVVGISMGGVIAQRFTLDYPDLVQSLTLISTSSEVGERARRDWEKTAAVIEQRGFPAGTEFAERVFAPRFVKAHPE